MTCLSMSHELRVSSGEHEGAVPMAPGVPLYVGTDWDNDVVLSSAGTTDPVRLAVSLELAVDGPHLHVEVLQGCIRAGTRDGTAGDTLRLPLNQPLTWERAKLVLGTAGPSCEPGQDTASLVAELPDASGRGPAVLRGRFPHTGWQRRGTVATLALAAASLGMLALASAVAPPGPRPEQQAHQAQALLQARGFTGLSVQAGEAGLTVSGHLESQAQRSQVERILQAEGVRARLQLGVNEQVVAAVREIYRLHGVAAEVQAVGPGVVAVKTTHPDVAAIARVHAVVRRDVVGLRELQADNQAPPRHPSPVPVVDDPGKRVAAVLPGDTAHVVTVDGTRYFQGALLPTGHRIVSIAGTTVQLEREGQASTLQF